MSVLMATYLSDTFPSSLSHSNVTALTSVFPLGILLCNLGPGYVYKSFNDDVDDGYVSKRKLCTYLQAFSTICVVSGIVDVGVRVNDRRDVALLSQKAIMIWCDRPCW